MRRLVLFHWNIDEARERLALLRQAGYTVDLVNEGSPAQLRALGKEKFDAFVIDLSRLPSHGREVGVGLRAQKATRLVPLLFVGGETEKVNRVKQVLPDATFTTWEEIVPVLLQVCQQPPQVVIVPQSIMDAYAGQSLPRKLGIKPGQPVRLLGAPANFATALGELPAGARLLAAEDPAGVDQSAELGIWFARTQLELLRMFETVEGWPGLRNLWIAWPKKAPLQESAKVPSDLTQPIVRHCGLDHGWVDYKVCSIDDTWSGLLFTRRKT